MALTTTTKRFDAGTGGLLSYIILQLSDSGQELHDKVVKPVRITGKFTDGEFRVYRYGATEEIIVEDIELGTNSATGAIAIPDTNHVAQTKRFPINVARAALHTIRVSCTWDGVGAKDRIDEIIYELADQGVRR